MRIVYCSKLALIKSQRNGLELIWGNFPSRIFLKVMIKFSVVLLWLILIASQREDVKVKLKENNAKSPEFHDS